MFPGMAHPKDGKRKGQAMATSLHDQAFALPEPSV